MHLILFKYRIDLILVIYLFQLLYLITSFD